MTTPDLVVPKPLTQRLCRRATQENQISAATGTS
jgi:hypothetical protein